MHCLCPAGIGDKDNRNCDAVLDNLNPYKKNDLKPQLHHVCPSGIGDQYNWNGDAVLDFSYTVIGVV